MATNQDFLLAVARAAGREAAREVRDPLPEYLTVPAASKRLGFSIPTIEGFIAEGLEFHCRKGWRYIRVSDLDAFALRYVDRMPTKA